jgi:hypothetical protein
VTWIVGTFVLGLVFAGALLARRRRPPTTLPARRDKQEGILDRSLGRVDWTGIAMAGSAGVWVLWTAFAVVHIVGAGHVGVVYTFGDVTGQISAGLQTTAPWQNVRIASTQVQREKFLHINAF